jgi:hypothetical protein
MTFAGLEPTPAGAYVTVCATEPMWSYMQAQYEGHIYNILLMQGIHTHHDTTEYIQIHAIHTHTYGYIHIHTPGNRCQEAVFMLCCSRLRILWSVLDKEIISDGA